MKNKISLLLGFAAIVAISLFTFGMAFKGEAQSQQNTKEVKKVLQKGKDKEGKVKIDPTVIQEGVMTAKQKKHSKIFKGYRDRAKLRDLVSQRGDVEVVQPVGNIIAPQSINLDNYLRELACRADAVVLGTVKSKAAQINEDGTFVFTDYEFTPSEVLKNNAVASLSLEKEITVTRTGGAVKFNGHTARAIDYHQLPLVQGERYILFLRFVPETGAYSSLNNNRDDDSFQILNDQMVQQVSKNPLPFDGHSLVEANGFMNQVRVAITNTCRNLGGGK